MKHSYVRRCLLVILLAHFSVSIPSLFRLSLKVFDFNFGVQRGYYFTENTSIIVPPDTTMKELVAKLEFKFNNFELNYRVNNEANCYSNAIPIGVNGNAVSTEIAGTHLPSTGTVDEIFGTGGNCLFIYRSIEGLVDIGVFARGLDSVGAAYLSADQSDSPYPIDVMLEDVGLFVTRSDIGGTGFLSTNHFHQMNAHPINANAVITALQGKINASFSSVPALSCLSEVHYKSMCSYADMRYERELEAAVTGPVPGLGPEQDFKIYLQRDELEQLISPACVSELSQLFTANNYVDDDKDDEEEGGDEFNEIVIRRTSAHGKFIAFHTDHSQRTLQVVLNDQGEYTGGQLVYATRGELHRPTRSLGAVTVHADDIVHGVTELVSGVRYALFLLLKKNKHKPHELLQQQ